MDEFTMTQFEMRIWNAHMNGNTVTQIAENLEIGKNEVRRLIKRNWLSDKMRRSR